MLFTLIGGVLADRHDRRRTLLASQYVQMATAATPGAAGVLRRSSRSGTSWLLSFVTGVAQAFGGPAYQSLIPSLVDKKDLPNAVALNSIQFNVARVLGPLLFGATLSLYQRWGFNEAAGDAVCFLLNALSFLVVIYTLMSLHVKHIPPQTQRPDARRAAERPVLRAASRQPGRAHRARGDDDVSRLRGADVPAALRAAGLPRRRRHLQPSAGVLGRRLGRRRAHRRVARQVHADGTDGAARAGGLRPADHRVRDVAHRVAERHPAVPDRRGADGGVLDRHVARPADRAERDARPRDEHLHARVPRRHAARQPVERLPRDVSSARRSSSRSTASCSSSSRSTF